MKPLQIGLLLVAGALGGALVMKVAQRPQPPVAAPLVAQEKSPAPAAAPSDTPPPAVQAPPAVEQKPSPAVQPSEKPVAKTHTVTRRVTTKPHRAPTTKSAPIEVAQAAPPQAPPVESGPVREAPAPTPPPVAVPPARQEPEYTTPPPPPEPHRVTLNAGMLIPVRLVDGLSSERNTPGDTFTGTLDHELVVDGFVIAERGARVEGKVVSSDRGGKVKGVAALVVELTRIRTSDGQNIAIQTDSFERHAEQQHMQDAAKIGGGAALGAIIGAIAGGGKGAAIGAGVGGGAGTGDVLLTRGKPATLPSETRISFRLRAPVTITERRG
jgi:hypothetical protein